MKYLCILIFLISLCYGQNTQCKYVPFSNVKKVKPYQEDRIIELSWKNGLVTVTICTYLYNELVVENEVKTSIMTGDGFVDYYNSTFFKKSKFKLLGTAIIGNDCNMTSYSMMIQVLDPNLNLHDYIK